MIATLTSSRLLGRFAPYSGRRGFVSSCISPCVLPSCPDTWRSQWRRVARGRSARSCGRRGDRLHLRIRHCVREFGCPLRGFRALLKDHERGLSIVFGSVTILLGMFSADGGPRGGSTPNDESIICPGSRFSEPVRLGFLFALGWTPCIGPTSGRSWLSPG